MPKKSKEKPLPKVQVFHPNTIQRDLLKAIRTAVADYIRSEGCSCCQGHDHKAHYEALGKILKVPRYDDDSGYNFGLFETPWPERKGKLVEVEKEPTYDGSYN